MRRGVHGKRLIVSVVILLGDAQRISERWQQLGTTVRLVERPHPVVFATGGGFQGMTFSTGPGRYYLTATSLCFEGDAADLESRPTLAPPYMTPHEKSRHDHQLRPITLRRSIFTSWGTAPPLSSPSSPSSTSFACAPLTTLLSELFRAMSSRRWLLRGPAHNYAVARGRTG